ncbi:type II signal peptidase [Scopulibacillus darangshiensis]|uniref:Type II signal peptidase n=1 Tax=Scopulibacillus darangshiensis TaxID=442528 RepID=A0A4R2P9N1_9BACL|nr:S8 family peptidase [Scopulibacillus darangshiensis]TCP30575.1 type II signal peptidase [Scopulibacillus darangshiensis]
MSEVRLIPFEVDEVVEQSQEVVPTGVELIEAPDIWKAAEKGKGVVVAVIDTGCESDHPDLKGRVIDGKNFTTDYGQDESNYEDNNGHGTHVCGTIAANADKKGVVGVAPEASILALKALTEEGSGQFKWIIDAINYAVDWKGPQNQKVGVISMSLGGPQDVPELHDAIKRAVENNISVVCAAGNEGDGRNETPETSYPGDYNEVVQVGAVDMTRNLAPFSNSNDEIDLVAPGVNVLSTFIGGRYAKLSGTSMATPHVSGAIALLINESNKRFERTLTEPEIYAQLVKHTVTCGYPASGEGNGIVALGIVQKIDDIIKRLTPGGGQSFPNKVRV